MKDKRTFRKCVRIIICKEDEILLCRRFSDKGQVNNYLFPGGGIEEDDSITETVVKECLEEVGVKVKNVRLLGLVDKYEMDNPNPERAKLFKGNEDTWCVCDFDGINDKHLGVEGDAMPYTWETKDNAIKLIKTMKFDGGGIDISSNKIRAITRLKEKKFSLESLFNKPISPKSRIFPW